MAMVAPGRLYADRHLSLDWASSGALARLLADGARAGPERPAFRDGPGREIWCGRPSFELSREIASEAVERLAAYLAGLGLEPGARVGICLPNGSEAAMSILAVGHAGLTPCLLDVTSSAGELTNAIEAADVRAVVTQAQFGPDRLAEKLCFVAAGFFRLRFLLAFGPNVPDGVVDLDPILLEPRRPQLRALHLQPPDEAGPGIVSFARDSAGRLAYFRSYRSLIAAAAPILNAGRIRPGDRLLTLVPADDLKGLATGIVLGLLAGAVVEAHAVFDLSAFQESLTGSEPTHLVAPGWMEPGLAELSRAQTLRSIIFLHEPPVAFEERTAVGAQIVDVICCSEAALLAAARREDGRISFTTMCEAVDELMGGDLLQVRREADDGMSLRGLAVAGLDMAKAETNEWLPSGLRIERNGTATVGIA